MHHVVVVSEVHLVRDCFLRVLNQYGDLCATPCAASATEIDAKVAQREQQAVLWIACDASAARDEIKKLRCGERVILLCLKPDRVAALAESARGFELNGDTSVEEIRATIHRQATLRSHPSPPGVTQFVAAHDDFASLTRREREVVHLVADGLSNKEIAGALHVSVYTAKNHVQRLLAKLELHSRSALVARYVHALNARRVRSG